MMYYACEYNCRGGVKLNDSLKRSIPLAVSLRAAKRKVGQIDALMKVLIC